MQELLPGKIYIIDDAFSTDECREYMRAIDNGNSDGVPFTYIADFDNRKFRKPEWSQEFYRRAAKALPSVNMKEMWCAGDLVMTGKYNIGEKFGMHTDTGLYYNQYRKACSRWTCLIYLNSDFEGGCTQFYSDEFKPTVMVEPKPGRILIFDIDLWHQGLPISGDPGSHKYWVGCEFIGPVPGWGYTPSSYDELFPNASSMPGSVA